MFPSRVVSSTSHDESAKETGDEQESLAGSRSIVFTIRLTEVHDKEVMVLRLTEALRRTVFNLDFGRPVGIPQGPIQEEDDALVM